MTKKIDKTSNINIIKAFFNNNLILLCGILIIASTLISKGLSFIVSVTQIASTDYSSSSSFDLTDAPNGSIFIGVIFILLYIFSKRDNDSIKVPLKIYAIYTYIQVVLSVVACATLLIMIPFIFISVSSEFGELGIPSFIFAIILIPAFLLFMIMTAYIERKYAKSIYESAIGTVLCKEGAKEHSILCFISAGISFILYIVLEVFLTDYLDNIVLFVTFLSASIGAFSTLLSGIIAKKYSEYIPDEEIDAVTDETNTELTFPDINYDTTQVSDPKYTIEIDVNTSYEEKFYE